MSLLITPAEILVESTPVALGPAAPAPPPALEFSVTSTVVQRAPGSVTVFVANGTPAGGVTFTLNGSSIFTDSFDDQGALNGLTLPVVVAAPGVYPLVAGDNATGLTATINITVVAMGTATSIGVPLESPPPAVQNTVGLVKRWVFQDVHATPDEVYHFPHNPERMTPPFGKKRLAYAATTAVNGQKIAFEGNAPPAEWKFTGTTLTQAHYDALTRWFNKKVRIWITDHYGRAWLCYLSEFSATPRRTVNYPYRHDYEMTAIVFQGPETPVVTP